LSTPTDEKAYADLRARFALAGHQFHRSNPADGCVLYYATRWGLVRELASLEDAERFLHQIGGAR
jgi:hypothetical protein